MRLDGKQIKDAPNGVAAAKLNTNAVETLKIKDLNVTEGKLAASAVTTGKINNDAVDKDKIAADVAGAGLAQNGDGSLEVGQNATGSIVVNANDIAVVPDDSTIENDGGATPGKLQVKALGIDTAHLADGAVQPAKADLGAGQDWDFSGADSVSVPAPSADAHAATKAYVDGVAEGLDVKESVVCATTEAETLASDFEDGDTIDGVTLATGDRVLVKDQASGVKNGIYVVKASGAPDRADDFAAAETVAGAFTFAEEGTANGASGFVCTNDSGSDVVGTDALVFSQFSGAGQITAGAGLTKSGNTIDVGDAGKGVQVNADDLEIDASESAGDGIKENVGSSHKFDVDLKASGGLKIDTAQVAVEPDDFAGTGLEDDGSDNLRLAVQGNGITGGNGSTLSVLADPTEPSIAVGAAGVTAAVPYIGDKAQAPSASSGDDHDTGITITATPSNPGNVLVAFNGVLVEVGDNSSDKECYFSSDGTEGNKRAISAIVAGDHFVWNDTVAGYETAATDVIDFSYNTIA